MCVLGKQNPTKSEPVLSNQFIHLLHYKSVKSWIAYFH